MQHPLLPLSAFNYSFVLPYTGKNTKGHATLKTAKCSLHIGHIDVHFHGGTASWLYNLFDSYIADDVKSNLQDNVSGVDE